MATVDGVVLNQALVARFGDVLRQAGYHEAGLRQAVGTSSSLAHDPRASEVARRRLADGQSLSTLIRLFCLGLRVPTDQVSEAIYPSRVDQLVEIGVLAEYNGLVQPQMAIDADREMLIAHDVAHHGRALAGDHVIGLAPAPRTLAALTVRSRVGRVLDLGTGSGIQALLAVAHADEVVATDINPRALAYTRFNAALNRVATPSLCEGNLFEPVANDAFDLIVANPPYVLSPDSTFQYRDSGMAGDQLSRMVVREAAGHLNEGGFASILINWAHQEGGLWQAPLAGWVRGLGCDAVVLHFRAYAPLTYASLWIKDAADVGSTLDRWLAYYRRHGIEAISSGAVILRRRSGVNWRLAIEVKPAPIHDATDHLLQIFAANDRLHSMADSVLLDRRFRPHSGHRIQRTGVSREGSYLVQGQSLQTISGIPMRVSLGEFGSKLLIKLDGTRTLRMITSELGDAARSTPSGDAMGEGIEIVKRLVALGFLEMDAVTPYAESHVDVESGRDSARSLVAP